VNSSSSVSLSFAISSLKNFMPLKLKIRLALLILLMVFSAFAEIVSIGMIIPFLTAITSPEVIFTNPWMQPILNAFSISSNADLAIFLTIGFCIFAIFSASIRLFTLWFQTRFCYSLGADLSTQLYKNSLYQPYPVHVARNSSEFISTIVNKTFQSTSFAILPILNILSSSLILLAITITLIMIEPVVALFAFTLFGALYAIVILLTRNKLDRDSQRISLEQDEVVKKLQEGFGGIRDILVSNTQEVYLRSYSASFYALQDAWSNVEIIRSTPRFVIEAFGIVAIALLVLYFSIESNGVIGVLPILGAMALGAQRMLPVLQLIYASVSSLRAGLSSLADILNLLEISSEESLIKATRTNVPFNQKISIENLKFQYDSEGPSILNGINLSILKGEMIGIIGSTGSGKTTFIDILMGLLHPSSGYFMVDDEVITGVNKFGWQSQLAHVPQTIFLIDGSITENIALGVPLEEVDFQLVKESARKAQIHDTIMSWDNQYNTIVGERGIRISGGQRQRIAIARALYKKASIIIFDEATSALDSETESSVMESILSLDKELTIIIVAHRLSTLKNCTNIIELSDGKILRQGVYNEIIK
jgi:ABC-type multidrug transport system fused ATPase/permease subunit